MDLAMLLDALEAGDWTEMGSIPRASNDTRLLVLDHGGQAIKAVYKPISGERPLIDFPSGTLALREVAAYRLSAALDLGVVPPTVLRDDLPAGRGSLQAYVEASDGDEVVTLSTVNAIPVDHTPIFALRTEDDRDLVLSHAVDEGLRAVAFFDLLANNADRKAGHVISGCCLPSTAVADIGVYGIDNGLTFHPEEKLRTVLWGFSRTSFRAEEIDALEEAAAMDEALRAQLSDCLSADELRALQDRANRLLAAEFFPEAPADRTVIPWPPI
ncbi:SCO1664 family protein [Brevibacterium sp. FAM 25378]|uniref:SCO1664 family protein n=2 Tax=Brevibacterium TaxID=1696 RepID=UPI001091FCCA|nr:SCO1664 family protein [Brevibacterium sp. S22]TGD32289.1 SCO1664 family protein [Brevibacterium sp. S22]